MWCGELGVSVKSVVGSGGGGYKILVGVGRRGMRSRLGWVVGG